jgi:valyl-tRNA synthetase
VLDALLRLLHPFTPFITEELWSILAEVAPERGLPEPHAAAEAAMIAPWPDPPREWQDKMLEARFERLQETIIAVRNIRGMYKISPKTPLKLYMQCKADVAGDMQSVAGQFDNLAKTVLESVGAEVVRPQGSASFTLRDADGFIPLEGVIDVGAELERKQKEADKIRGLIAGQDKKLPNERFVSSAPAEVVQDVRDKRESNQRSLESILTIIAELDSDSDSSEPARQTT